MNRSDAPCTYRGYYGWATWSDAAGLYVIALHQPAVQAWCVYSALNAIARRSQRLASADQRAASMEVWEAWWDLAIYAQASEVAEQQGREERERADRSCREVFGSG